MTNQLDASFHQICFFSTKKRHFRFTSVIHLMKFQYTEIAISMKLNFNEIISSWNNFKFENDFAPKLRCEKRPQKGALDHEFFSKQSAVGFDYLKTIEWDSHCSFNSIWLIKREKEIYKQEEEPGPKSTATDQHDNKSRSFRNSTKRDKSSVDKQEFKKW